MTKECSNDSMPKAVSDLLGVWVSEFFSDSRMALIFFRNSGLSRRMAVPEGLCENSPAFQRRETCPGSSSPEGTAGLTGGRGENGGGIISPQIQRRPQMGGPEGWPHEGAKKR